MMLAGPWMLAHPLGIALGTIVAVPAIVWLSYPIALAIAVRRRPPAVERRAPPAIAIVVPLCGDEEGLRANLEALIAQRARGGIQLVFVAEDPGDPALVLARSLACACDHVELVVSGPAGAEVAKSHNLAAGLARVDADAVVFADSDARPPDPGFVERLVAPLAHPGVGLVTCVPSYRGARDLGAGLLAAMIDTDVAGLFGLAAACDRLAIANGTCLAVRADVLGRIGGITQLRRRLLMDTALARVVAGKGLRVVLHHEPVPVHRAHAPLREVWSQAHRWHVALRFGLPLAHDLGLGWLRAAPPLAALAFASAPGAGTAAALVAVCAARIASALLVSRGFLRDRASGWVPLLQPAADVVASLAWLASFVTADVSWRGSRYRVRPGALVSPVNAAPGNGSTDRRES